MINQKDKNLRDNNIKEEKIRSLIHIRSSFEMIIAL